jgi:hypothetical protein
MNEKDRVFIKHAIDTGLSGLSGNPCLAARIQASSPESSIGFRSPASLILALLLLAVAVSAIALGPSAVLEYLFPRDHKARDSATPYVQKIDISQKSQHTNAVIKDALIQDGRLSVGLSLSSEQPVFIVTQSISLNGQAIEVSSSSIESQWLRGELSTQSRGFTLDLTGTAFQGTEKGTVRLNAALLRPINGIKQIDIDEEDIAAVWAQIDQAIAEGLTPVSSHEPHEVLVGSHWMRENAYDMDSGIQYPVGSVHDYLTFSNMQMMDRIEATFTINPSIQHPN